MIGPLLTVGGLVALVIVLRVPMPDLRWAWLGLPAVVWLVLLWLFPEKKCYVCGGKGHYGLGPMRRTCGRCGGSGRIRRVGASSE